MELRPAGVAAAGGRAGDIAAADLGQGGAAPAGVTAAGGRAGEVGPADLGQARRSLKVELRPAGVAAAGGRAGDIAAADLGQGGAAPAGVTAAGGRAGEVGPADLGQAPRSLRQGRCTEHASRGARLSDHCVCAGSEQEAGRAARRGMLHAVSGHMRAVFAS